MKAVLTLFNGKPPSFHFDLKSPPLFDIIMKNHIERPLRLFSGDCRKQAKNQDGGCCHEREELSGNPSQSGHPVPGRKRKSLTHPFFVLVLNAFKMEAEARGYDVTFINDSSK